MTQLWCDDFSNGYARGQYYYHPEYTLSQDCEDFIVIESHSLGEGSMRIPHDFPGLKMVIENNPPKYIPDYFSCGPLFMVSNKMKELLETYDVNVQYNTFTTVHDVPSVDGVQVHYCNIRDYVECIDVENGEYIFWEKEGFKYRINTIIHLAIDEHKAAGYHLFRLAKGGEHIVCVSDYLANAIFEEGIHGVKFVSPEKWNNFN